MNILRGMSGLVDIYEWIWWVLTRDRRQDACVARPDAFEWCDD